MLPPYYRDLGDLEISDDEARIDVDRLEALLRGSYWAGERSREQIERSLQNSRCFGAYRKQNGRMIGFCRVVTDYATFSWLTDVIVEEDARGAGVGKALVEAAVSLPELQGVRMVLATRDAHGLYRQYGFEPLPHPEPWMIRPG